MSSHNPLRELEEVGSASATDEFGSSSVVREHCKAA